MTRRPITGVLLAVLMGLLVGVALAARSESVEVRDRSGRLGVLTVTVLDDGAAYIAPDHLAALLKGAWSVKGELAIGVAAAQASFGGGLAAPARAVVPSRMFKSSRSSR